MKTLMLLFLVPLLHETIARVLDVNPNDVDCCDLLECPDQFVCVTNSEQPGCRCSATQAYIEYRLMVEDGVRRRHNMPAREGGHEHGHHGNNEGANVEMEADPEPEPDVHVHE